MSERLTSASRVVASKDQVSSELSGEAAILNLKNGTYYGLNSVGARIWNLIVRPMAVSEIVDILMKEYAVDRGRCEREALALLQAMSTQGLVELVDEPVA